MMVHPDSHGVPRVPRYSGTQHGEPSAFAYGTITLYGAAFQSALASIQLFLLRRPLVGWTTLYTHNPDTTLGRYPYGRIGLGYSPFARRYLGNLC